MATTLKALCAGVVFGLSCAAARSAEILAEEPPERSGASFMRGDGNDDGVVNVADTIFLMDALFKGALAVPCENAADANGDRRLDQSDALFTLEYLFRGSAAPPSPGPTRCDVDPSREALSCETYTSCQDRTIVLELGPPPGGPWSAQGPGPVRNGQTENVNPNNEVVGAIHTVVAHPTDATILWVGGANGGIWRTNNATAASPGWTPLIDGFPTLAIGAMELDPTDGTNQTLVAGIGRFSSFGSAGGNLNGLLRTTNGGNSWTRLGQIDLAGRNVTGVAPRGATILVSTSNRAGGTAAGVYRSTNTGGSFTNISGMNGLGAGQVFDLVGDPGNQNRLYASTANGLFRTDDLGGTWTNITTANVAAVLGGTTNNVEFAVHNNAGGGTNAVYVAIMNNGQLAGIFRSPDQGANWTAMDTPRTNEGGQPFGLQPRVKPGSQGATHFSIVADPTNANVVYVGGDRQPAPGPDGVEFTNDDAFPNSVGATDYVGRLFRGDASVAPTGGVPSPQWTSLTHNGTAGNSAPHADSREMVFDPNGNIVEVDDGGIYRRTSPQNANGDWASINGNIQTAEFHDIAYDTISNRILAGAQDNGVSEQDSGVIWRAVSLGDGGDVAVDTISRAGSNESIRYSAAQNLGSFRRRICDSSNSCGGATTIGLNTVSGTALVTGATGNVQFVTPVELNVVDPTRLLIGGANDVYESTDQGDNVTQLTGPGANSNAMVYGHADNIDLIYIGSGSAVFARTTAGANLTATATAFPGGTVTDIVLDPADQNVLYVADGSQVFTSPDGGGSWDDISGNVAAAGGGNLNTLEYIEGDENDILVVGSNAGVLVSVEPHFDCWFKVGTGFPNVPVWDLDYDPADDLLLAGTMGRGAWTITGVSEITVPTLSVPGNVVFPPTCVGEKSYATLHVCNTGKENLLVEGITSSNSQFTVVEPTPGYPVVISPDFCFPFQVIFEPTAEGLQTASFVIESNDPCQASLSVGAEGRGTRPKISTVVANSGSFGDVCVGSYKDLDLTVNNSGSCDLTISALSSSSTQFQTASAMTFPLKIHPGDSLQVPIRFQPTSFGAKNTTITITTNDPTNLMKQVAFSGNAPSGDIRVTGSTDFGDVCAGELAEKTVSICNVGGCNLDVSSVAFEPPCADFTLINNPYPAPVSPDFCLGVVIRFTPTSVGPKSCTLVIRSDDPDQPVIMLEVTGNVPAPDIDVPPDQAFAATVLRTFDSCETLVNFPISNTGECELRITDVSISQNPDEYSLEGLPSFPIILEPGHIVGEGDLRIVFSPIALGRERSGMISVTYVSDPITGDTETVTRKLCGEGVKTGARVLVTAGGVPVSNVERLHLQRINANRNREAADLDTVDNSMNLAVQSVTPAAPCTPFQFHREFGTVTNSTQLLPGFFQVTVTAVVAGRRETKIVGFSVDTCEFNATIKVEF